MTSLDEWEEITGTLSLIREEGNQILITISGNVVAVSDLSLEQLNRAHNKKVSVIRTESEHRLTIEEERR